MTRSGIMSYGKKTIRYTMLFPNKMKKQQEVNFEMNTLPQNPLDNHVLQKRVLDAYHELDNEISEKTLSGQVVPICKKGCASCCADYFYISKGEYLAILGYLREQGCGLNPFIERAKTVKERIRGRYPEEYNILSQADSSADYWDDNRVPNGYSSCIFLENGLCSIYLVRPIICRLYGISRSYALCDKILRKCKPLFWKKSADAKLISQTVDIPYDDRYTCGIDYVQVGEHRLLLRPYPLYWWFADTTDE